MQSIVSVEVRRVSVETIGMIAARRLQAGGRLSATVQGNISAFIQPAMQMLVVAILEDPRGCVAVVDTLADTLLALVLAEQAHFQQFVQGLIATANGVHQTKLGEMFMALVSGNGLSGQYTRQQKVPFRAALKLFVEQVVGLVAETAVPIRQPAGHTPDQV